MEGSERHVELHETEDTVRESQQPWETLRDMQWFHGTERNSERKLQNKEDSVRHVVTPWDRRDSEIKTENVGGSERHAATP